MCFVASLRYPQCGPALAMRQSGTSLCFHCTAVDQSDWTIVLFLSMAPTLHFAAMLRHLRLSSMARRTFTSQIPKQQLLSKVSTPCLHVQSCALPQSSWIRPSLYQSKSPTSLKVAGFHASGRKAILPAGPRKSIITSNIIPEQF